MTSSPPFCANILVFLKKKNTTHKQNKNTPASGLFTCRTGNYSQSSDWQCHTLESAESMLVCAAGSIVFGNGQVAWEPGMATEKFDGPGRTCTYEKRMGNFIILGKPP